MEASGCQSTGRSPINPSRRSSRLGLGYLSDEELRWQLLQTSRDLNDTFVLCKRKFNNCFHRLHSVVLKRLQSLCCFSSFCFVFSHLLDCSKSFFSPPETELVDCVWDQKQLWRGIFSLLRHRVANQFRFCVFRALAERRDRIHVYQSTGFDCSSTFFFFFFGINKHSKVAVTSVLHAD